MENLEIDKFFKSVYRNKNVFITGHTGFKGSWLSLWLIHLGANVFGFSLPEKTTPSHFDLLNLSMTNYTGDILESSHLEECMKVCRPDIVFHLAAQPLVRESYRSPVLTYQTNIIGTLNVLEAVRKTNSVKAVVNITTDKVYENKEWHWPYRENDALGGYDLYSSSKACSEILTASYRNSFLNMEQYGKDHSVLIATARAGNVIGGGDWAADRLIPDVARATSIGTSVEIRHPQAIRPWEHVLEPLSGYLLLGQRLLEGNSNLATSWNFGPDTTHTLSVGDVLSKLSDSWPELKWINRSAEDSTFHEAGILKLDCSKAHSELGWSPVWNINETLQYTASWYHNYYRDGSVPTEQQLFEYVEKAQKMKSIWTA